MGFGVAVRAEGKFPAPGAAAQRGPCCPVRSRRFAARKNQAARPDTPVTTGFCRCPLRRSPVPGCRAPSGCCFVGASTSFSISPCLPIKGNGVGDACAAWEDGRTRGQRLLWAGFSFSAQSASALDGLQQRFGFRQGLGIQFVPQRAGEGMIGLNGFGALAGRARTGSSSGVVRPHRKVRHWSSSGRPKGLYHVFPNRLQDLAVAVERRQPDLAQVAPVRQRTSRRRDPPAGRRCIGQARARSLSRRLRADIAQEPSTSRWIWPVG